MKALGSSPSALPTLEPDDGGREMICRRCGGSGIQRVADQRFRTCYCCLGQGTVLDDRQALDRIGGQSLESISPLGNGSQGISAAASSSAAR